MGTPDPRMLYVDCIEALDAREFHRMARSTRTRVTRES